MLNVWIRDTRRFRGAPARLSRRACLLAFNLLAFNIGFLMLLGTSPIVFGQESSSDSNPFETEPLETVDLSEAKRLFATGEYESCLKACTAMVDDGIWNEEWYRLKIDTEMLLGRYAEALKTLQLAIEKYSSSVHLRWRGVQVYHYNNRPEEAQEMLESIPPTVREYPWRFSDASNRVVIGRYELAVGLDAKEVLTTFYDKAKSLSPRMIEPYQAIAELALDKHDDGLAAKELRQAISIEEDNATLHYLLARSLASSDAAAAQAALDKALSINPQHVEALLWTADMTIDGEQYEEANEILRSVEKVNPLHPRLWAYRAVIAHLQGDYDAEAGFYQRALKAYPSNPEVDHLIGRKLAQKYRFAEGAEYQRQALEKDGSFLPAKFQLSQDLLRLGEEQAGWAMVQEVYDRDNYNVVAHNLVALHDVIDRFRTLERDGIVVRMSDREAELYGNLALDLLVRAKQELAPRYETPVDKPVIVEIFPEQKDFAIRTFGLPGGQGFLGVCFGRVITANSPASQGTHPSNWEATLWHEFCHAVTLEKTNNRMPRWLSEGISVYEERRAGPGWGQTMNDQYRQMIIDGELVPVSQLSDAFLTPKSSLHLQFAYYESSLVVEYLVEKYGMETLLRVLTDLGVGMPINESLGRYVGSIEALDNEFETYARGLADGYAKDADWAEANLPSNATPDTIKEWLAEHPQNIEAMRQLAESYMTNKQWDQAVEQLDLVVRLFGDSPVAQDYAAMSMAYRQLGLVDEERETLEKLVEFTADAKEAHQRLLAIASDQQDWPSVLEQSKRLLAIDPLQLQPHESLARAAMELGENQVAIDAYRALLQFQTTDLANCYYQLAQLYTEEANWSQARRHVLFAIEAAPRYREAFELYLKIKQQDAAAAEAPTGSGASPAESDVRRGR